MKAVGSLNAEELAKSKKREEDLAAHIAAEKQAALDL